MKEYADKHVKFHLETPSSASIVIVFQGKSTAEGMEIFFQWVEEEIDRVGVGNLSVLLDLQQLVSIPLSIQMKMASWILRVKNTLFKVAVVGGGRSAKLLVKGAKMSTILFFDSRLKAESWLAA